MSDGPESADPTRIRALAVTADDVVDALEASARGRRRIVLRVTPPFSGRMRARLHDPGAVETADATGRAASDAEPTANGSATDAPGDGTEADSPAPIHVPPERFVADPPTFPTVDDTEDELRASPAAYTRERHRERHRRAVEAWRDRVRERLADEVALRTGAGTLTVSVSYL